MLTLDPATPDDVDAIHALRRQLEDWMVGRVVQWPVGSLPRDVIAAQVDEGGWFVVRDAELGLAGTIRVLSHDPTYWGDDPTPAVYVHGLMVDRRRAGSGLGRALLDWAASHGREVGVGLLRLDCRETNPALRAYYEGYGLRAVGRVQFATHANTLLEMPLTPGR